MAERIGESIDVEPLFGVRRLTRDYAIRDKRIRSIFDAFGRS